MKTNITGIRLITLAAATALFAPTSLFAAPPVDASGGLDFGTNPEAYIYNYLPVTLGGGEWTDQNGGLANIVVPVGQFTGFYDDGTPLLPTDLIPLRATEMTIVDENGDTVFEINKNFIGTEGPAGPAGANGPAGPGGPAGPAGADGPKGENGADGATGPKGDTGPQGATGPKGDDGAQGPTGSRGPAGARGATGPAGPVGARGATGAAGARGATGATGPQGARGPQGPAGVTLTSFAHGTSQWFNIENLPSSGGLASRYNCTATGYTGNIPYRGKTTLGISFDSPTPSENYAVELCVVAQDARYLNAAYISNKTRNGFTIVVEENADWVNTVKVDFAVYLR